MNKDNVRGNSMPGLQEIVQKVAHCAFPNGIGGRSGGDAYRIEVVELLTNGSCSIYTEKEAFKTLGNGIDDGSKSIENLSFDKWKSAIFAENSYKEKTKSEDENKSKVKKIKPSILSKFDSSGSSFTNWYNGTTERKSRKENQFHMDIRDVLTLAVVFTLIVSKKGTDKNSKEDKGDWKNFVDFVLNNLDCPGVLVREQLYDNTCDKAKAAIGLGMYLLLENNGENRLSDGVSTMISDYNTYLKTTYPKESSAHTAVIDTQKRLLNQLGEVPPRGLTLTGKDFKPEKIFITPNVTVGFRGIQKDQNNIVLLEGDTGTGKTYLLNVLLRKLLMSQYSQGDKTLDVVVWEDLEQALSSFNPYIVYINPEMFLDVTGAYATEAERGLSGDFVKLFHYCMWEKSDKNYFSNQRETPEPNNFEMNEQFLNLIQRKAAEGKLLLVLDAFDEISPKNVDIYLEALKKFRFQYCQHGVGASILITSRNLGSRMDSLYDVLGGSAVRAQISGINETQAEELVKKWCQFDERLLENQADIIDKLTKNRMYQQLSANPYMLSLLINYHDKDLASVIDVFINDQNGRLRTYIGNLGEAVAYNDVKDKLQSDIKSLAAKAVQQNTTVVDEYDLRNVLRRRIIVDEDITTPNGKKFDEDLEKEKAKRELAAQERKEKLLDMLIHAITAQTGVLIPGEAGFEFINPIICYHLAADALIKNEYEFGGIGVDESNTLYPMMPAKMFTALCVCMLGNKKLKNPTAEKLMYQLVVREVSADEEQTVIDGIVDILLGNYSNNALTGQNDNNVFVKRAKRLAWMKLKVHEEKIGQADKDRLIEHHAKLNEEMKL